MVSVLVVFGTLRKVKVKDFLAALKGESWMRGGLLVGHFQFHPFYWGQTLQYCSSIQIISIYIFCGKFYLMLILLFKNAVGLGLVKMVTLEKE